MIEFDDRGREIPNPIPVEVPIQWKRPPTIQEQIKMFVRRELSQQAADSGAETFEEADDFDVGDDYDPSSPYEEVFDVSDPNPGSASASAAPGPDVDDRSQSEGDPAARKAAPAAEKPAGGGTPASGPPGAAGNAS